MKQEEVEFLKEMKKKEGKNYMQISKEINQLRKSQAVLSSQSHEINYLYGQLNKKDKEVEDLKKELSKLKNKNLMEGLKNYDRNNKGRIN